MTELELTAVAFSDIFELLCHDQIPVAAMAALLLKCISVLDFLPTFPEPLLYRYFFYFSYPIKLI